MGNTTAFDLTLNGDDEWSVTLTAQVKEGYYRMSLTDGTATNADGTEITSAKAGDTVKLTAADAPEGMVFDRWEISPADVALTLEEGGFDSHAATASFKMPAQTLSIRAMYRMADQPEEPNVLAPLPWCNRRCGRCCGWLYRLHDRHRAVSEHCPARWCGYPAEHRRTGKAGLD
mgnify:FL=1